MYQGRAAIRAGYFILRGLLALCLLWSLPNLLSDEWQYRLWSPLTAFLWTTAMIVYPFVVIRRELRGSRAETRPPQPDRTAAKP
ncbi:hypothetical protein [Embleya scabrispora]|uniref:hypothetical protein n=1 Tax=Embleya scabrispora TaxID=159449 RepID=UPI000361FE14|nr:hypothetical protein [Embleya scabrispora]MYS82326.1 hypothetical protein [Streptomyces sp. SID5474]